ncbi:MAG TPA: hypothetical protein PLB18_20580, partial [Acidobacteriota bacterium]|nr:hypothetical protein [Acidobacteriota bacterium]
FSVVIGSGTAWEKERTANVKKAALHCSSDSGAFDSRNRLLTRERQSQNLKAFRGFFISGRQIFYPAGLCGRYGSECDEPHYPSNICQKIRKNQK